MIPIMRNQKESQVHLLTYAAPVTRMMLQFNGLSYYAILPLPAGYQIPTWLQIEVGFFAGRIYFEWHEYESILRFLGLVPRVTKDSSTNSPIANGQNTGHEQPCHTFTDKPLAFLQDWVSVRRKMQDWSSSPVGFIVSGKTLHAHHTFFAVPGSAGEADKKVFFVSNVEDRQQEEGEYDDDDVFFDANDYADAATEDGDWDDRKSTDEERQNS